MKITIVIAWLAVCAVACVLMHRRTRAERESRRLVEPFDYVQIMPSSAKRGRASQ